MSVLETSFIPRCGRAVRAVRAVRLSDTPTQTVDEFLLRGIPRRSEVGFLTLFEHHDYVHAGSHYKLPQFPIWVVCSESHYSTFFAAKGDATPLTKQLDGQFDLLYYDGCVPTACVPSVVCSLHTQNASGASCVPRV